MRYLVLSALVLAIMSSGSAASVENSVAFAAGGDLNKKNDKEGQGGVPLLPESDPNTNLPRVKLGETISFEEMGPVIINSDGTTRRIANWDEMTEKEREVTWRRISKRNEERRKILLEQQNQQLDEENREEL